MAEKKKSPTTALATVIDALEPLADSDRQWVLQSAAARWTLQLPGAGFGGGSGGGGIGGGGGGGGGGAAEAQAAITQKNARVFMRLKNPATDMQRMACLGFFLVHTTNNPGFSSKALRQANTDSGGTSINFPRAIDNATRIAKYLSNRGPREKQLTTLGEDIVIALPDQQAVRDIEAAQRRRGSRARRKKKA